MTNSSDFSLKMSHSQDFPCGPVVKNLPSNTGYAGLIPGLGTKIPQAVGQLSPCTTVETQHGQKKKKITFLGRPLCHSRHLSVQATLSCHHIHTSSLAALISLRHLSVARYRFMFGPILGCGGKAKDCLPSPRLVLHRPVVDLTALFKETQEEKAMAPHSSTLAWKIPWMEEPSGLQSMGSLRVRHD